VPEPPPLPAEHTPKLSVGVDPKTGALVGDLVRLTIRADAPEGDDVTVTDQSFAPFEVLDKRARVEPVKDGRHTFVFEIDLLSLEPGEVGIAAVELRVVTKDGLVGFVKTDATPLKVGSLIANEPNAQPKAATKPVSVTQDDYTLLYVVGGLAGATLIALLTLWISRWWRGRAKRPVPPAPPRPPWEIAVEKLAALRRRKSEMLEAGQGVQLVDLVSDVVREYLGGVFGFDGLETTSDEMIDLLRRHGANVGLSQEVRSYLGRCDLVKFAKVVPDRDEVDLLFAKAQDIVQFDRPAGAAAGDAGPSGPSGASGVSGASGASGTSGAPGTSGASDTPGTGSAAGATP
jgi:uncharacterized membrane protein YgcG